jgi:hypothetical protein
MTYDGRTDGRPTTDGRISEQVIQQIQKNRIKNYSMPIVYFHDTYSSE